MSRAIFLLGVSKTEGPTFGELKGVKDAVDRIERWARIQLFDHIVRLTDATGPVTIEDIKTEIASTIKKDAALEQIIIYFSGHGVVNGLNEFWLLSRAPDDSGEAVNVTSTATFANAGSIPHVILISDACRTATNSIQTGRIDGSNIFPNKPNPDTSQAVDIFYATKLGAAALEVAEDRTNYIAVYTETLAEALNGNDQSLVENGLIRPHPLKDWLKEKVPRALAAKNLVKLTSQTPDAQIGSGRKEWIARFTSAVAQPSPVPPPQKPIVVAEKPRDMPMPAGAPPTRPQPGEESPIRSSEAIKLLVNDVLSSGVYGHSTLSADGLARQTGRPLTKNAMEIFKSAAVQREPDWEESHQRGGFVVIGESLIEASNHHGKLPVIPNAKGSSLHQAIERSSEETLLQFSNRTGILLPSLRDYICFVEVQEGKVAQVHYEPALATFGGGPRVELQQLRAAFFAASKLGELHLEPTQIAKLGAKMQSAKFADPALAIYAAYAYQSIGKLESIREMAGFLVRRQHIRLFDVSLLAREFLKPDQHSDIGIAPSLPLLTQGWAYMEAFFPKLPPRLEKLRKHVGTSLWAQYDQEGMDLLDHWMMRRELKKAEFIHF